MADLAPTPWALDATFKEARTFAEAGVAKFSEYAGLPFSTEVIMVRITQDPWRGLEAGNLTGWKTDDFNP